jgi:hypothetical protein
VRGQERGALEGSAGEVAVDDASRSDKIRHCRLPLHGATILRPEHADLGRGA